MRLKLLVGSLFVVIIVAACFVASSWNNTSAKTEGTISTTAEPKLQNSSSTNNQANPDDIPDRLAYMLLFRFLSNSSQSQDENVRRQARVYLKRTPIGRQSCNTCAVPDPAAEADISVLIAAANEFQQRVDILDQQATRLKRQNRVNPNPNITAQLAQLQQRKEALADTIIAALPGRLSNEGRQGLQRFIREYVKRGIKLN
ncbi:MAG: hypothetical protein ACR2HG_09005 [Pyrinomonadaceae bacterium]